MKIGDLVHVPPVRTVVRLADLGDRALRHGLVEAFVFTAEVSFALAMILHKIVAGRGEGFFVIGNYGSGKSHLLNILSISLNDDAARRILSDGCRDCPDGVEGLPELFTRAAARRPLVVEVSLVEHSNREHLEQIVLSRVAEKLGNGAGLPDKNWLDLPRTPAFQHLCRELERSGYGGLVLLIDELSEFLRSKETAAAYNEDVRFLQYLGELAGDVPAWIVATMQENIETTGSLSGELLHKIKDRYPVRFQLSGAHVKAIVSGRLVRHKEAAADGLPRVLAELQDAFTSLPFSREDFIALYPVHPATVELLDELRTLFSQHRGVIDFIHYRLAGDPRRAIPSFLEQPATALLTPDYIFDHFRDRIRETVETSAYSEQVYHHFEREAGRIFPEPEDALTALRLLKLLILGALGRAPRRFTAAELTRLLLYRYSGLESSVNYDYIDQIMSTLHDRGAYIAAAANKGGEKVYRIDLKADVALLIEKKLARYGAAFAPGDPRLLEELLPWIDEPNLPLWQLQQEPAREEEVTWQNTRRRGRVIYGSPATLTPETLTQFQDELETEETDFMLFIVPPGFAAASPAKAAGRSVSPWTAFFEHCAEALLGSLALWVPREITAGEEEQLRRACACRLLQQEYAVDTSPAGQQVSVRLENRLAEEKRQVCNIFRHLYYQGGLKAAEQILQPAMLAYLPFSGLLSRVAAEILKERYPRHFEIRPLGEQVTGSLVQRALELLVSPRPEDEPFDRGSRLAIDNYLRPLGLVKKKGSGYLLEINPKTSPLVAAFFSLIPETGQIPLEKLYWKLRKGPFGLSGEGFRALGTAAIVSGAVSAYRSGKRLAPSQAGYYQFWQIEVIGPGTLIRPELQQVLAGLPFLPARLRALPLTFTVQQQAWEAVVALKQEWTGKIADLRHGLGRLQEHPLFGTLRWDRLTGLFERFAAFLEEIKVSYSSREGLERFLAACRSRPLIADDWSRLAGAAVFLDDDLPAILRLGHYLSDPALVFPAGERYLALSERRRRLLELLEEEGLFWDQKFRDRLKREFRYFQDEYIELYLEEHRRMVGPDRFKPYRSLMETRAYHRLEQFSRLNAVPVKDDLVSVNRCLARPLERECRAAEELLLRERPLCPCGFRLGEVVELPAIATLEAQVKRGIGQYFTALCTPELREKITAHAEHLEQVGRRREAVPLRQLLQAGSEFGSDLGAAAETGSELAVPEFLFNQTTIARINRALTGDAIIAERSLDRLCELFAGRVFTVAQMQELFRSWLAGAGKDAPEYIRVAGVWAETEARSGAAAVGNLSGSAAAPPETERRVSAFLEAKQPRLAPLVARAGLEKVCSLALLFAWAAFQRLHFFSGTRDELDAPVAGEASAFARLIDENLSSEMPHRRDYDTELSALGESFLSERETLPEEYLAGVAAAACGLVAVEQLLEYLNHFGKNGAPFRFDTLLELLLKEPFFPAISRALAAKLAVQITEEGAEQNLRDMVARLQEVCARLDPGRAPTTLTSSLLEEKKDQLNLLQALAGTHCLLYEVERAAQGPLPREDRGWERLYRLLAPLELALARLEQIPARILVPSVTVQRWRHRYVLLLETLHRAFAAHLRRDASLRRRTLPALFRRLPRWAARESAVGGVFLVLLDGARLDLWQELLVKLFAGDRFRIKREGLLWAFQPTVTVAQLQPLKEAGLLGHVLHMDDRLIAELIADPETFFEAAENRRPGWEQGAPLRVLKYDFIDEKVHVSRDPLPVLLDELLLQGRRKLGPLLDCLPDGALVLCVADHGFQTNLHYKGGLEEPLYLHGAESLFEVLAPWALMQKTT